MLSSGVAILDAHIEQVKSSIQMGDQHQDLNQLLVLVFRMIRSAKAKAQSCLHRLDSDEGDHSHRPMARIVLWLRSLEVAAAGDLSMQVDAGWLGLAEAYSVS